jgi:hypothetical protein
MTELVTLPAATATDTDSVDFDLHGLCGIRLIGAGRREVQAVARQLGLQPGVLQDAPDVVVRFVPRIEVHGPLRLLGLDDVAFSDDAFFILRGKHKTVAKAQIPVADIGGACEIVCEHGLVAVPQLIAIINMAVLGRGALPLHAAAFDWQGRGVLATGWSKGGKTETLLAFMAHGAHYIGDEWVYLSDDGRMAGIPEPIRLWAWHLRQLPALRRRARRDERLKLDLLAAATRTTRLASRGGRGGGRLAVGARRVESALARQACLDVPPARLFGAERCVMQGRLDRVLLVMTHAAPHIDVQPMSSPEVAERMLFSLQEEQMRLLSLYHKFRFAFPGRPNAYLEAVASVQRDRLARVLHGKRVLRVLHPYPVSLPDLFAAVRDALQ